MPPLKALEHDDDHLLCDEDCASDEEHALDVAPDLPLLSSKMMGNAKNISGDVWCVVKCMGEALSFRRPRCD